MKRARQPSVNHRKKPMSAIVIEMPAPAPPAIPVNEVMSFLRKTPSALTWSEQEIADSLRITQAEAGRERVENALADLEDRIAAVNRDRRAAFHIADAVAFGDFLLGIPRVQPAEAGVRLGAYAQADAPDRLANGQREFLRPMRGKGGLLRLQSYQPWMSSRSHRQVV